LYKLAELDYQVYEKQKEKEADFLKNKKGLTDENGSPKCSPCTISPSGLINPFT
jgi:hypothetical protein